MAIHISRSLKYCLRMSTAADSSGLVTEGRASARLPKGVFYNPVQEFNRDLTIVVISAYENILRQEKLAKARKKMRQAQKDGRNLK